MGAGGEEYFPGLIEEADFFGGGGDLFLERRFVVARGATGGRGCGWAGGEFGLVFLVAGEVEGEELVRSMDAPSSVRRSGLLISWMRLLIARLLSCMGESSRVGWKDWCSGGSCGCVAGPVGTGSVSIASGLPASAAGELPGPEPFPCLVRLCCTPAGPFGCLRLDGAIVLANRAEWGRRRIVEVVSVARRCVSGVSTAAK